MYDNIIKEQLIHKQTIEHHSEEKLCNHLGISHKFGKQEGLNHKERCGHTKGSRGNSINCHMNCLVFILKDIKGKLSQ